MVAVQGEASSAFECALFRRSLAAGKPARPEVCRPSAGGWKSVKPAAAPARAPEDLRLSRIKRRVFVTLAAFGTEQKGGIGQHRGISRWLNAKRHLETLLKPMEVQLLFRFTDCCFLGHLLVSARTPDSNQLFATLPDRAPARWTSFLHRHFQAKIERSIGPPAALRACTARFGQAPGKEISRRGALASPTSGRNKSAGRPVFA